LDPRVDVRPVTDTDAADLLDRDGLAAASPKRRRWQTLIMLIGLVAIAVAAISTVGDASDKALPGPGALCVAFFLVVTSLILVARAWATLFPETVDRQVLTTGFYTSQLTKYLPAGGFVQAASQVALSGPETGVGSAALRLPVFSLCAAAAGATLGAGLMFATSLPAWARVVAGLGLVAPLVLDRRILSFVLRAAQRFVRRLPDSDALPPQRAILRCYAFSLGNMAAYAAAFAVLLGDVTDVNPVIAGVAMSMAWVAGYVFVISPSGLGIREAILIAALPGLPAAPLLAASLAQRLLGVVAEAGLAGVSRAWLVLGRRRAS
jgi:glycosyltransferase 2 family protein